MTKIRFENLPSTKTPINAENLNKLNNVVISSMEPITGEEVWIQKSDNLFNENYYSNNSIYIDSEDKAYKYVKLNITGNRILYFKAKLKDGKTATSGSYLAFSNNAGDPQIAGSVSTWVVYDGVAQNGVLDLSGYNDIYLNIYPKDLMPSQILENYDVWVSTDDADYDPYVEKKIYIKNNNNIYDEFLNVEMLNKMIEEYTKTTN